MAKNVDKIADRLGANLVGQLPETGGGAFGAARLAALLQDRLTPSRGVRPGRPTDPTWVNRPKVPMSRATLKRLERLAKEVSTPERSVSSMQVAAQLIELSLGLLTPKR